MELAKGITECESLCNRVKTLEDEVSELKEEIKKIITPSKKKVEKIKYVPENHNVCKEGFCMARSYINSKINRQCLKESNYGLCVKHLNQYNKSGNKKLRCGWWGVLGPESNNYKDYSEGHAKWSKRQYFWEGTTIIDNRPEYARKEYPLD